MFETAVKVAIVLLLLIIVVKLWKVGERFDAINLLDKDQYPGSGGITPQNVGQVLASGPDLRDCGTEFSQPGEGVNTSMCAGLNKLSPY